MLDDQYLWAFLAGLGGGFVPVIGGVWYLRTYLKGLVESTFEIRKARAIGDDALRAQFRRSRLEATVAVLRQLQIAATKSRDAIRVLSANPRAQQSKRDLREACEDFKDGLYEGQMLVNRQTFRLVHDYGHLIDRARHLTTKDVESGEYVADVLMQVEAMHTKIREAIRGELESVAS